MKNDDDNLFSLSFFCLYLFLFLSLLKGPVGNAIDEVADLAAHSPDIAQAAAASALGEGKRVFNQAAVSGGLRVQEEEKGGGGGNVALTQGGGGEGSSPKVRGDAINMPPVPLRGVPSHWTPISVGQGSDPTITLCKLDYDTYWRAPSSLPMFKDLLSASKCSGRNMKTEKLSHLKKEMDNDPDGMCLSLLSVVVSKCVVLMDFDHVHTLSHCPSPSLTNLFPHLSLSFSLFPKKTKHTHTHTTFKKKVLWRSQDWCFMKLDVVQHLWLICWAPSPIT
jgi:hypothetical protein